MLNPFPIQFLALIAYFILRVVVGFVFIVLGIRHWKQRDSLSMVLSIPFFPFGKISVALLILTELLFGTLFVLGLHTQIAALIAMAMSVKMLFWRNRFNHPALPSRMTYLLLLGIACSLFITGAGVFAFDLPI